MSKNVVECYKPLVRAYTTYQPETGWALMPKLVERFKLDVVDSDLNRYKKLDILKLLDTKLDFSEKHGRYAIEKMLSDIATKLGCYDEYIFDDIACYNCYGAQIAVIERW